MSQGGKSLVPRSKREVLDVPEARPPDRSLDQLLRLRKQRVERYEQERRQARENWREERALLRRRKQSRRDALAAAREYWQQARSQFIGMVMTSGQYRRAKAVYGRMKDAAAQLYLECQQAITRCRAARAGFFEADRELRAARLRHEKLSLLKEELRSINRRSEE